MFGKKNGGCENVSTVGRRQNSFDNPTCMAHLCPTVKTCVQTSFNIHVSMHFPLLTRLYNVTAPNVHGSPMSYLKDVCPKTCYLLLSTFMHFPLSYKTLQCDWIWIHSSTHGRLQSLCLHPGLVAGAPWSPAHRCRRRIQLRRSPGEKLALLRGSKVRQDPFRSASKVAGWFWPQRRFFTRSTYICLRLYTLSGLGRWLLFLEEFLYKI